MYWYVHIGGQPFPLSMDRMRHVISPGSKRLNLFGGEFPLIKDRMQSLALELPQVSDEHGRGSVSAEISDQATIACDSDKPSLGAFSCTVQGTLTAHGGDTEDVSYEFSGTMRWFDFWDFDPHLKATVEQEAEATLQRRTGGLRGACALHTTTFREHPSTSIPKMCL